jgi:hypothetical protein
MKKLRILNRAARRGIKRHPNDVASSSSGIAMYEDGLFSWARFGFDRIAYKKLKNNRGETK